jgi:hypothetical protein
VKVHVGAWALGSVAITVLWVLNQRNAHGSFQHFGSHAGNDGDWNPTLWALGVGLWGLVVGIIALGVAFEGAPRLFHAGAWTLGMLVLTPLWALLEWQDNGGFARWSDNGRPGDWEPWIVYVGGCWAAGIVLLAVWRRLRVRR